MPCCERFHIRSSCARGKNTAIHSDDCGWSWPTCSSFRSCELIAFCWCLLFPVGYYRPEESIQWGEQDWGTVPFTVHGADPQPVGYGLWAPAEGPVLRERQEKREHSSCCYWHIEHIFRNQSLLMPKVQQAVLSILHHYFLFILPLRSTTAPLVFKSAVRVEQPSVWTTARQANRRLMRRKVLQDRNRCLWGKSWLCIPFNVLSLVSPQWVPLLLQSLRPADFHVSLLSPASSSAPRRNVQRKCSCLESVLWKVGTAFLSQPFLKYLVILRNRFWFSGDIMLYILLPLVARQPLEDLSWTPSCWGVFGSTP